MHLPHPLEQRLVGLRVAHHLQRRVLLEQAVQRHAHFLLLLAVDLQRVGDDALGLGDHLQLDGRGVGGAEHVAHVHVLELHQADDLARPRVRDFGGAVPVDAIDVLHHLAVAGARIEHRRARLDGAAEDAAGGEPPDEMIDRVAEGEHGERRVALRRARHLVALVVLALDLAPHRRRRQVAHDGIPGRAAQASTGKKRRPSTPCAMPSMSCAWSGSRPSR